MSEDNSSSLTDVGTGVSDKESSIEPVSRPREIGGKLLARWMNWAVVLATVLVTVFLYQVGGVTIDTIVFGLIAVVAFVYTVVTFRSDLE